MILTLAFTAALMTEPPNCSARLEAGHTAYGVYNIAAARAAYADALSPSCSPRIRADAVTEAARIDWLIYNRAAPAVSLLSGLVSADPEACQAATLLARILVADGRALIVPEALGPKVEACRGFDPMLGIGVGEAWSEIARTAKGASREKALASARAALASSPTLARSTLAGSRLELTIGMIAGDPSEAMSGWRRYFWLDDAAALQAFEGFDADSLFIKGLSGRASDADRAALAKLLVRGGFDHEARYLVGRSLDRNATVWREIHAYLSMRERLEARLLRHDRALARGEHEGDEALEADLLDILKTALADAGRPTADLWPELRELWGLVGTTGTSNGVSGLHLGHVSEDRAEFVSQGGRKGEVQFVALDNMIANGFSGWLGDGAFGPGGWAADGRIIQVRTRYVKAAFDMAAIAESGVARDRFVNRMRERTQGDAALAKGGNIVFLPGLSDRLRLQAVDALAAELRSASEGDGIARRFAAVWYERNFQSSIVLHEGRHALDQAKYQDDAELSDAELEFRAKMSEMSFSTSPRIALVSIYGRLLGGTTGHGIANARILRELTHWMSAHAREIEGFDPAPEPLPQVDRLTEDQIRAFARLYDPENVAPR